MSDFREGDRVLFRQVAPDGYASDSEYDILIEDGTAYQIHRGRIREIKLGFNEKPNRAVVNWDDGETTETGLSKLDSLEPGEAPEWYEPINQQ